MAKISRGLDIPFKGSPAPLTLSKNTSENALVGLDYKGLKPRMLVKEGEAVSCGQPIIEDKRVEGTYFCAPVSGTIKLVQRGQKRVLQNVIIEKNGAGDHFKYQSYKTGNLDSYSSEDLISLLKEAGSWSSFRTRPFSIVPDSSASPSSIFVTAIDSNPLSFDPSLFIQKYQTAFNDGLKAKPSLKILLFMFVLELDLGSRFRKILKLKFMNSQVLTQVVMLGHTFIKSTLSMRRSQYGILATKKLLLLVNSYLLVNISPLGGFLLQGLELKSQKLSQLT